MMDSLKNPWLWIALAALAVAAWHEANITYSTKVKLAAHRLRRIPGCGPDKMRFLRPRPAHNGRALSKRQSALIP